MERASLMTTEVAESARRERFGHDGTMQASTTAEMSSTLCRYEDD